MGHGVPFPSSTLTFVLQADPLSYDPPDVIPDFEAIYGEGAAEGFFPQIPPSSTPDKGDSLLPVLKEDSPCGDDLVEFLQAILAPELPSGVQGSPPSSAGCIRVSPTRSL